MKGIGAALAATAIFFVAASPARAGEPTSEPTAGAAPSQAAPATTAEPTVKPPPGLYVLPPQPAPPPNQGNAPGCTFRENKLELIV